MAARRLTAERLANAGFIWADDEAAQLCDASRGDPGRLDELVARRLDGEPLAWITGRTAFCDLELSIDPGVYVPRPHTEPLALRAAELLPAGGHALDLCTGCGAIAAVMAAARPGAKVLAADIDERAVACARRNGVAAVPGDLFEPFAAEPADVITAVVPYVPTAELETLHRDTFAFEGPSAYHGGADGLTVLRRVIAESPSRLRPAGVLLLEVGAGQASSVTALLRHAGFERIHGLPDAEGEVRALEAVAQ